MLSHENSSAEQIDNIEKSLKRNEPMICSDIPARGVLEHQKCIKDVLNDMIFIDISNYDALPFTYEYFRYRSENLYVI